jgi:hypothetical protein
LDILGWFWSLATGSMFSAIAPPRHVAHLACKKRRKKYTTKNIQAKNHLTRRCLCTEGFVNMVVRSICTITFLLELFEIPVVFKCCRFRAEKCGSGSNLDS